MQLTQEDLEAVSLRQMTIMDGALKLLGELPDDPNLCWEANVMSAVDGLVGAIAMMAEASGVASTPRRKRHFADNVRTAVLKSMKEARAEIVARLPEFMGAANDVAH